LFIPRRSCRVEGSVARACERLGHEQERTTHVYLHADLALKQRTLDRIAPPNGHPGRYRAPDAMLAFLDNL
jgi:integrase/recombinase XerD